MTSFEYTPDADQKIHAPGAISLICAPYQSHETGLPEWAKNSANAYFLDETPPKDRIVLVLSCDRRKYGKPSIACLDFVGITCEKIETYFRQWADPDAAAQGTGSRMEGGHGNGGKCYMTQMFTEHAVFHTVRDGKGCRYGVKGGEAKFGYVPSPDEGRDYSVSNLEVELDKALAPLHLTVSKLPQPAKEALSRACGFTLVRGVGPKYFESKIRMTDLVEQVKNYAQMVKTLEYCQVFVIHNGHLIDIEMPLRPSAIEPIPEATEPRIVEIPGTLVDPLDCSEHSTTNNGSSPLGHLILLTSKTSMRRRKKFRHTINYKSSASGLIGYRSMLEFPVQSGYRDKIYGECELDSLEEFKVNHRGSLAESPLTRAVENWIAEEIQTFAAEFEKKDRADYTKKERNELSRMNEALDRWKNRFLQKFMSGAFGGGPGANPHLPSGKPARIELIVTHPQIGLGVAIRPRVRFYDVTGRQIRPVPYRWVSENPNVALVDDDLMLVNSFTPGETVIYAETTDGELESNRVPIQVIRIRSIRLEPRDVSVAVGSRTQLRAVCSLSSGEEIEDVALIWTEGNGLVARVSFNGSVYGIDPGQTEVVAGDDKAVCDEPAIITVTDRTGDAKARKGKRGKDAGKNRGGGYPLILVSGEIDVDPETDEYVFFSPDDPPVWQRPQDSDRNIWWINSAAPLAKMLLEKELGFGYESREWRMYPLERYVDIITQIAMSYDPQIDGPLTVKEFFLLTSGKVAEIQAATVEELMPFIQDGVIPGGVG